MVRLAPPIADRDGGVAGLLVADFHGLYAVLVAALLVTAAGGRAPSRHLLGPLDRLTRQAQALAGGDLTRRAETGRGPVADVGVPAPGAMGVPATA